MLDLSIVIPTVNRAESLAACLVAVGNATQAACEIIVVDGASSDSTATVLSQHRELLGERLRVIREDNSESFARAVNKGFRAARGRCVTWLNEDARPLPRSLDRAMGQLAFSPHTVGMVALFHTAGPGRNTARNIAFEARHQGRSFHLLHVRGTLCAQFGIATRSLFEQLGYFDERYLGSGAVADFSLKVWHAGFSVVPALGALVDEAADTTRDEQRDAADNALLLEKWNLPDHNPSPDDFDQTRPCTLRGPRTARAA